MPSIVPLFTSATGPVRQTLSAVSTSGVWILVFFLTSIDCQESSNGTATAMVTTSNTSNRSTATGDMMSTITGSSESNVTNATVTISPGTRNAVLAWVIIFLLVTVVCVGACAVDNLGNAAVKPSPPNKA